MGDGATRHSREHSLKLSDLLVERKDDMARRIYAPMPFKSS